MKTDTFSQETKSKYENSPLWKPWMEEIRLRQIEDLSELEEFLEQGETAPYISWDLETSSLDTTVDNVCGHCLAFNAEEGVYIPTRHINHPNQNLDHEAVWSMIVEVLNKKSTVVYNWRFEGKILEAKGLYKEIVGTNVIDAMVYRWLFDPDKKQYNLKEAADDLFKKTMLTIHETPGIKIGRRKNDINFALSDPHDATLYAAADPVFTLAVLNYCRPKVDTEQKNIVSLEHQILNVLFEMERGAVTIDRGYLRLAKKDLTHWIDLLGMKIYAQAKEEFDVMSPQQVGKVLVKLGVKLKKNEKTGNLITNAKEMEILEQELKGEYPIVQDILFYRSLIKERSTYADALLEGTSEKKPTALFRFSNVEAPTGRFSSGKVEEGDPLYVAMNAQSIPNASSYVEIPCHFLIKPPSNLKTETPLSIPPPFFSEERALSVINHPTKGIPLGKKTPPKSILELDQFYQRDNRVFCFRSECKTCTYEPNCERLLGTIRSGSGTNIRRAFCAEEGFLLASIDYRQIEIRVAAQLSGEPLWLEAFNKDLDLHTQMARIGWKIPESQEVPKAVRDAAKCCNFSNLFGGTARGLSEQSELSLPEAVEAWKIWWNTVKTYKAWTEKQFAFYKRNKYVETPFGRRRDMSKMIALAEEKEKKSGKKGGHKEGWGYCDRTSLNSPIQGGAADILKIGMVKSYHWIKKEGLLDTVRMLLTVHDELLFQVRDDSGKFEILREIGRQMTCTRKGEKLPDINGWRVPLEVDIEIGKNWAEMQGIDELDPATRELKKDATFKKGVRLTILTLTKEEVVELNTILKEAAEIEDVIKVPLFFRIGNKDFNGPITKIYQPYLEKRMAQFPNVELVEV